MKEFPSNLVAKGDIVLLENDNTKRIQWKMGMVEQLITGKDGQVRGEKCISLVKVRHIVLVGLSKRFTLSKFQLSVYKKIVRDRRSKRRNGRKMQKENWMKKQGV